jgi:CheY-like chemotaxis protein
MKRARADFGSRFWYGLDALPARTIERLRALPEMPPDLDPIAITGYGRPADVQHSRKARFSAHLVKPSTWTPSEACCSSAASDLLLTPRRVEAYRLCT